MQTKALQVAAYFLIAHYLISTALAALAFLGKGTVDYLRLVFELGFLLGSVGALFRPRKLGWVMVVAYAWYSANPIILGAWAMWASPELQSSARIGGSIVLAVISSPLIVALVLVFRPSSFAYFKNPPLENVAPQASKTDA